jgi:hypothetical protein
MKFYKITNTEEKHHGLHYQDGLNVDYLQSFNPSGNCLKGGIYFSREDILCFLHYGPWIREVTLPENEEVYENPGDPQKWKAHQVILGPKREITPKVLKELVEEGAVIDDRSFQAVIWLGNLNLIKAFVSQGYNPCDNMAINFQRAIAQENFEVLKYLTSFGCNPANFASVIQMALNVNNLKILNYVLYGEG